MQEGAATEARSILGVYAGLSTVPARLVDESRPDDQDRPVPRAPLHEAVLEQIERGEIDPSFVVSHPMNLDDTPRGYDMFMRKQDDVMKIVLRA